jgi:capreomycidine synthase
MHIARALLEDWMRAYYFACEIDIGSSGVQNFSLAHVRELTGLTLDTLDRVVFDDSPSCGAPGLRRAIAERWSDGDPERVMATHGSSEVIFLVMSALLEPGDEVVVLDPCYHSLVNLAAARGCPLKRWRLRYERGYRADLAEARALIGPKTRMVVCNLPHNPTGASLGAEDFEGLLQAVEAVGAYLVWDSALADLVYEGEPLPDPTGPYRKAISIGTLSKGYGLAGLRVGWCIADPELLRRFVHLRDYTTLYLSPLVEAIASAAIERGDELLRGRRERARTNLEILARWIEERGEDVEWVPPRGGVTAFPRLKRVTDVDAFCHRLAREQGVMVVPGSCFDSPSHIRVGFGGATPALMDGLSRMARLLAAPPATLHA